MFNSLARKSYAIKVERFSFFKFYSNILGIFVALFFFVFFTLLIKFVNLSYCVKIFIGLVSWRRWSQLVIKQIHLVQKTKPFLLIQYFSFTLKTQQLSQISSTQSSVAVKILDEPLDQTKAYFYCDNMKSPYNQAYYLSK